MPDASTTTQTSTPALDLAAIRAAFPSLNVELNGQPVVYFDNPGGTQVPQACIDAITQYLSSANANTGGAFLTSQRTDAVLDEAHAAMADFLNASRPARDRLRRQHDDAHLRVQPRHRPHAHRRAMRSS